MARITRPKLDKLAHDARRLTAGIDRMVHTTNAMTANPRAKYGRTVQLLAAARGDLTDCRSTLRQIDAALADTRPRTAHDDWTTVDLVASLLRNAAASAEHAAFTLRDAADTLGDTR